ncbi:MAG: barstar family protein [Betaproteobacteria bacterium]|nr:barstar family protein [Betaproteobacteria bacterium]
MTPSDNGIHPLPEGEEIVPTLDARTLADKQALLAAIGEALSFPDYYGANWDALEECLTDLSWRAGPLVLHLAHAEALPEKVRETLEEVFLVAAKYWRERGRVCQLFLS